MKKPGHVLLNQDPLTESQDLKSWRWEMGHTHFCKTQLCLWLFPSRTFAFSLIPNGPAYSESINLITNHPLSMWQDQVSTFYLLTVQMQVQYHCGHKVQDSENITKHVKATAAGVGGVGGGVTNMPAHQVLSTKTRKLTFRKICHKNTAVMTSFLAWKKRAILFKHCLNKSFNTVYQKFIHFFKIWRKQLSRSCSRTLSI